jgi:hypothetical protein
MLPRNFRGGEITHSIGNFVAEPNYHCVLITLVPEHFNRQVRSHWSEWADQ